MGAEFLSIDVGAAIVCGCSAPSYWAADVHRLAFRSTARRTSYCKFLFIQFILVSGVPEGQLIVTE